MLGALPHPCPLPPGEGVTHLLYERHPSPGGGRAGEEGELSLPTHIRTSNAPPNLPQLRPAQRRRVPPWRRSAPAARSRCRCARRRLDGLPVHEAQRCRPADGVVVSPYGLRAVV